MFKFDNNHPDFHLWILLPQATDVLVKVREAELREIGLTRAQAAVLFILKQSQKPNTPADIARFLFREPHTITALIDRMRQRDLVTKVRVEGKKKQYHIYITDKGANLYEKAKKVSSVRKVFSALTKARKKRLISYLVALRDKALDELTVKPKILFP